MSIFIRSSYSVSEIGRRQNNEDSVFPDSGSSSVGGRLFLVCDGVGGAEKGEVASALACHSFHEYFLHHPNVRVDTAFISGALEYTEKKFDEYVRLVPEAEGMATTLTLAYVGERSVVLSHIGDSRIYWIRNGKIIFRTEDHSLVNTLVRLGKITPEEALVHPRRNVILRAIQGSGSPTEAETRVLTEIEEGDFLFLCTDGVLEGITDEQLAACFSEKKDVKSIADEIRTVCKEKSRDNYSFYILSLSTTPKSPGIGQKLESFLSSFLQML